MAIFALEQRSLQNAQTTENALGLAAQRKWNWAEVSYQRAKLVETTIDWIWPGLRNDKKTNYDSFKLAASPMGLNNSRF
jgi:hypothetical protein